MILGQAITQTVIPRVRLTWIGMTTYITKGHLLFREVTLKNLRL